MRVNLNNLGKLQRIFIFFSAVNPYYPVAKTLTYFRGWGPGARPLPKPRLSLTQLQLGGPEWGGELAANPF
jgi:hypothetical protein